MIYSKRKRQASPDALEPRRSEPWFEEGTVVIHAEDVQFKVHRDMLSKHSPVFKDMFSLPQHSSVDGPLVDGCAVVDLHDSARDVEYMLRELYSLRPHEPDELPEFDYLAAMLRLGKKYLIDRMRIAATNQLRRRFPSNLDEVMDLSRKGKVYRGDPEKIELLNLAHETGELAIMPLAFLTCRISAEDIFRGLERKDGTIVKLVPENQERLIVGRARLRQQELMKAGIFAWAYARAENCTAPMKCSSARSEHLISLVTQPAENTKYLPKWKPQWAEGLCAGCVKESKEIHERSRRALWEDIPFIWGLPSWGELMNSDV